MRQQIHDFMDEEDRQDDLAKSLRAKDEFQTIGSTQLELQNKAKDEETEKLKKYRKENTRIYGGLIFFFFQK